MGAHINKEEWIGLFRETGLDDEMMLKWHKLFESRHPEAHENFLVWLGLPRDEVKAIRLNSK